MKTYGCQSMVGTLNRAMVKRPQESYIDDGRIDAQWEALAYLGRPDLGQAIEEHRRFVILLEAIFLTSYFPVLTLFNHNLGVVFFPFYFSVIYFVTLTSLL